MSKRNLDVEASQADFLNSDSQHLGSEIGTATEVRLRISEVGKIETHRQQLVQIGNGNTDIRVPGRDSLVDDGHLSKSQGQRNSELAWIVGNIETSIVIDAETRPAEQQRQRAVKKKK